jgi:hypothetical protein
VSFRIFGRTYALFGVVIVVSGVGAPAHVAALPVDAGGAGVAADGGRGLALVDVCETAGVGQRPIARASEVKYGSHRFRTSIRR